jgi:leukotriene-A4 hydrolase
MLLLRQLESAVGRRRLDAFLRAYFRKFAFQSITTGDFVTFLQNTLMERHRTAVKHIDIPAWIRRPGLPANIRPPRSRRLHHVQMIAEAWGGGVLRTGDLPARDWTTHEWVYFLRTLSTRTGQPRLAELDKVFHLTRSPNAEVASQWLVTAIQNRYTGANVRLRDFLNNVGRLKYLRPVYDELAKRKDTHREAMSIFQEAKPVYHPAAVATIQKVLQSYSKEAEESGQQKLR